MMRGRHERVQAGSSLAQPLARIPTQLQHAHEISCGTSLGMWMLQALHRQICICYQFLQEHSHGEGLRSRAFRGH